MGRVLVFSQLSPFSSTLALCIRMRIGVVLDELPETSLRKLISLAAVASSAGPQQVGKTTVSAGSASGAEVADVTGALEQLWGGFPGDEPPESQPFVKCIKTIVGSDIDSSSETMNQGG